MKRLVKLTSLIFILVFTARLTYGQDTTKCNSNYFTDPLLEKLTGRWTATGNVGGDQVTYYFSVQWVLNHQFLELTFADTATNPEYTAKVFIGYNCPSDRYIVHWIDNFGGRFSETLGHGKRKDQSIEILFEYPEGQLINTFSYDKVNNSWTSHSTTKDKKGNWVTFGDIHLKRAR